MPGPFTYFANIPVATDQLSVSQPQFLTNFGSLKSYLETDHVVFSSSNAGQHQQVSLPTSAVEPTFALTTIGLYNFVNAITGLNELTACKYVAGGTAKKIPMTASVLSTNATPIAGAEWWSYLPSGLILKGAGSVSQVSPYTFPVAGNIPAFAQILSVVLTVNDSAGGVGYVTINTATANGFSFTLSPGFPATATIAYTAVGY